MLSVDLFVGTPFRVLGNECVFASDDLALEVCRQARMVFGQTYELVSLPALYIVLQDVCVPLMRK